MKKTILYIFLILAFILTSCSAPPDDLPVQTTASSKAAVIDSAETSEPEKTSQAEIEIEIDFETEAGFMDVFVFATGKSDAILITTENHAVLIDTGENKNGPAIADYLINRGIDEIDYLIITHFHKDHIGGADTIIKNFGVKKVIVPNYGKQSKQYSQFVSAMLKMKLESDILTETMEFTLDNTEFTLYPPLLEYYDYNSLGDENDENDDTESDIPNENDFSIVVRAEHGENNFLFAADAAKGRLGELMANEDIMAVKYDFLKVPYHGRYSKRSLEFIDAVKPKYAVITCSADSGDKSGDQRVISALEKNGAEVYLTPNGGVYCVSNGYATSMIQPFGF